MLSTFNPSVRIIGTGLNVYVINPLVEGDTVLLSVNGIQKTLNW